MDPLIIVVCQVVNFLILVFLLKKFLFGRILDAMKRREERIRKRISEAKEAKEAEETVTLDNGSIRSFNSDNFRVPTFVRKQMD